MLRIWLREADKAGLRHLRLDDDARRVVTRTAHGPREVLCVQIGLCSETDPGPGLRKQLRLNPDNCRERLQLMPDAVESAVSTGAEDLDVRIPDVDVRLCGPDSGRGLAADQGQQHGRDAGSGAPCVRPRLRSHAVRHDSALHGRGSGRPARGDAGAHGATRPEQRQRPEDAYSRTSPAPAGRTAVFRAIPGLRTPRTAPNG